MLKMTLLGASWGHLLEVLKTPPFGDPLVQKPRNLRGLGTFRGGKLDSDKLSGSSLRGVGDGSGDGRLKNNFSIARARRNPFISYLISLVIRLPE
jgi:hypothetical protein